MPVTTPCTNRESLRVLLERGGTDQEIAQLETHLQQCDRCGELFEEMVRDDEVTQSVRGAKRETESDIPALKGLCERLSRLRPMRQKQENTVGDERTLPPTPRNQVPEEATESGLDFLAPAQQADELGRLGNYRILKKLGAGGMGMVFLAEDMQLHRKVALKTMLPGYAMNAVAKDRFLREARAAAAVEHENIVAIHQVGEDRNVPYLAMPFLKGESLEDRLDREKKLPLRESLRIAAEMAEGLAAAHENGLIHRDIKPGNVWLEGEPSKVKLLDFGLARSRTDDTRLTQSGTIVGTPAFMAPEQAKGEDIDGRADLFSLGCVLYVMLTGQRPFKGNDTISLLMALALENPPTPQVLNHDVPDAVGEITMCLLAKDANERPATAKETAKVLRGLMEVGDDRKTAVKPRATKAPTAAKPVPGKPSSAKPVPAKASSKTATMPKVEAPEPEAPPKRSRKPMVLAGLLLLVGILAAAGIILRLQTDKGELILEAGDESIEVTVKQAGKQPVVLVLDKHTKRTLELTVREGEIEARELPEGIRFKASKFEVERGGRKVFTASMLLAQAPPVKPPIDDGGKKDPSTVKPGVPREKPFVLVRKGAEAGEFKTFTALWESHKAGDEIVVYGNGPFNLPRVTVKDRALVLRAAPGFRPLFQTDESVFDKKDLAWIHLDKGSLTTEGCDFAIRNVPPGCNPPALLGGEGPCVLRNGRFLGEYMLSYYRGPSLIIEDSLLLLNNDLGKIPPRCEMTLTNNIILANQLINELELPGGQTLRLTRNAILIKSGANLGLFHSLPESTGIRVMAEGNWFDFTGTYNGSTQPVMPGGFKERLHWQGKDNVYAGLSLDLEKWNGQLAEPEVNSRVVTAFPFAWRMPLLQQAEQALAWWEGRLSQSRRESGLPGLGPDLSLLGPGEAYLRARAADGKAVPKEQLRPEAHVGGRVVLIRGGKEERGFREIQAAFDVAQDGDVIEIRSDAKLLAGMTRMDSGSLTLRAAPGYRPVISGGTLVVSTGSSLAVEGLAFAADAALYALTVKDVPPAKQPRVPRLVSCSFDKNSRHSVACLFQGADGSAGEVTRCVIMGSMTPMFVAGSHVRFRECLFSDAIMSQYAAPAFGTYEMDRCIAYRPRFGLYASIIGENALITKDGYRWRVRNSLLESVSHLVRILPQEWTGEKNLYRFGNAWSVNEVSLGLAQWRALKGVKETGSVEAEPWIADPQSWKLTDKSIPDGIGPDISRIARRAQAPDVKQPVQVDPNPAKVGREKAFVLMRKGEQAGEFSTFASLWEKHQPGDEIVVHGNGPFKLPPVVVKDRALVLKAAAGFRPVFVADESVYDKAVEVWIRLDNGSLTTEGCDFTFREMPPGSIPRSLISGQGSCVLRNGRFLLRASLTRNFAGPSLTVEDSLLVLGGGGVGYVLSNVEVTLTNNLIYTGLLFDDFVKPGGQKLRLTRNAIISHANAVGGMFGSFSESTGIVVETEGNLMDFSRSYGGATVPVTAPGFKDRLRWKGKNNVYAALRGTLEKWNEQLAEPEVGSTVVNAFPFGWALPQLKQPAQAMAWWKETLDRLRRESGLPGLGPNLSLVGSGEAYLRSLEAEGKAVPKERLRPEPLAGGRVTLIRDGKEVRGYQHLQDAFDAAKDGDILELRTDAALPGGVTGKDSGNLTLRAAPGYRPVISSLGITVFPGTALSLEGLTFSSGMFLYTGVVKDLPPERRARITRLANCSFDLTELPNVSVSALFLASDGGFAEITRCVILGQTLTVYDEAVRLRFRESLLLDRISGSISAPAAGAGVFEVDRCVVFRPRSGAGGSLFDENAAPPVGVFRWTVRDSLLESPSLLLSNPPRKWEGERNLFRIGCNWVYGDEGYSLAQWRARENVKETGSKEGEPIIHDPSSWALTEKTVPDGVGPDVSRIGRVNRD